jgi:hypothetical protein
VPGNGIVIAFVWDISRRYPSVAGSLNVGSRVRGHVHLCMVGADMRAFAAVHFAGTTFATATFTTGHYGAGVKR